MKKNCFKRSRKLEIIQGANWTSHMFNLIKKLININKLFITDEKQVNTPINTKKFKKILTDTDKRANMKILLFWTHYFKIKLINIK